MCSAGSNGPTSSSMPEAYKGPAGRCSGTAAREARSGPGGGRRWRRGGARCRGGSRRGGRGGGGGGGGGAGRPGPGGGGHRAPAGTVAGALVGVVDLEAVQSGGGH